jgi:small subunit ribosomal protein S20
MAAKDEELQKILGEILHFLSIVDKRIQKLLLTFASPKLIEMAHHKSAKKRIRQSAKLRLQNRYYGKTTRNAIRELRATENKAEAEKMYPQVVSMIDKLARRNQIHKKKAANLKSSLALRINSL